MSEPLPAPMQAAARQSTLRSLLRLQPYLRPHRATLRASTALAVAAALLALAIPQVLKWIVDVPVAHHKPLQVALGGLALLLIGAAESSMFGIRRRLAATLLADVEASMRADIHRHTQRLPITFHDRWSGGQLLSRGTTDLQILHLYVAEPRMFLPVSAATLAVGAGILISEQWLLAVIVLAPIPFLILGSYRFESAYARVTRTAQDLSGDLTTEILQSVTGIRVIKGFRRSEDRVARFRDRVQALRQAELAKARLLGGISALLTVLPGLATAGALVLGAVQAAHGQISTGTLLAFLGTVAALAPAVEQAGPLLAQCHDAAAAANRFFEVVDEPAGDDVELESQVPGAWGAAELVLDGVGFCYPDAVAGGAPALLGVSLRVAPGETLAVVGATGSGKTTLASLIPRLYDPTEGRITLDGVDTAAMTRAELRAAVAIAFDEPVLFSGTVLDNVLLGAGSDATRLDRALQSAHADDFIRGLQEGSNTRVGENATSLSGGQRQRIALARVLARRPRLIVLDDPLSALDVATETRVHDALREVLATTTALVIAHRPSTVRLADRVALLEGGRVIAVGTHEELLQTSPQYAALMTPIEAAAANGATP